MTIKELILKTVNEHQGIKAVELVVEVSQQSADFPFDMNQYENSLMELINDNEIVEIEYTLPSMDYRVKSLYLPKDTVVIVSKAS